MIQVNKNIQELKPSATLAINQKVIALRKSGEDIYHFGFGQSPFPIHHSIVDALKEHATNNKYLPSFGLGALRQQICRFLEKHQDIKSDPDYIYIGPGSKELLYQTILILEGTFLIPKGSWVSYLPQIKSKNGKFKILDTLLENNFKLTPKVLERYCKKHPNKQKSLILNSPNNPTGAVYSEKELNDLAKVCKQYKIIVLSDEIYSQLNFSGNYSPSISKYYPEKTIVFGGLSKVFSAGGYRLGFMSLPKDLHFLSDTFRSLFSETFSAVASPIQYAAIEAFKMPTDLQKYIKDCTTLLKEISSYVYSELSSINIECTEPQGAFYTMVGFNNYKTAINSLGIYTSEDLSIYLLEHYKVALLPATDFYFDESELFFRLAFVDFDGGKVLKAYRTSNIIDKDFIKEHFYNVFKGLKQIKQFTKLTNQSPV